MPVTILDGSQAYDGTEKHEKKMRPPHLQVEDKIRNLYAWYVLSMQAYRALGPVCPTYSPTKSGRCTSTSLSVLIIYRRF
jgi:hypothetical protein